MNKTTLNYATSFSGQAQPMGPKDMERLLHDPRVIETCEKQQKVVEQPKNQMTDKQNHRFVYQSNMYALDSFPCTAEVFDKLVDDPQVAWKINTRQAVDMAISMGEPLDEFVQSPHFQRFCQNKLMKPSEYAFQTLTEEEKLSQWATSLKQSLPCFIFGASSFDQVMMKMKDGQERPCRRRLLTGIHLSGLFMFDADHLPFDPHELFEKTQKKEFPWQLRLAHKTSSGHGLRLVLEARPELGNIADNQIELARELGLFGVKGTTEKPVTDNSCIDASRVSYCPRREDILFIDYEKLFNFCKYEK